MSYITYPISNRLKITSGWRTTEFNINRDLKTRSTVKWIKIFSFMKNFLKHKQWHLISLQQTSIKGCQLWYITTIRLPKKNYKFNSPIKGQGVNWTAAELAQDSMVFNKKLSLLRKHYKKRKKTFKYIRRIKEGFLTKTAVCTDTTKQNIVFKTLEFKSRSAHKKISRLSKISRLKNLVFNNDNWLELYKQKWKTFSPTTFTISNKNLVQLRAHVHKLRGLGSLYATYDHYHREWENARAKTPLYFGKLGALQIKRGWIRQTSNPLAIAKKKLGHIKRAFNSTNSYPHNTYKLWSLAIKHVKNRLKYKIVETTRIYNVRSKYSKKRTNTMLVRSKTIKVIRKKFVWRKLSRTYRRLWNGHSIRFKLALYTSWVRTFISYVKLRFYFVKRLLHQVKEADALRPRFKATLRKQPSLKHLHTNSVEFLYSKKKNYTIKWPHAFDLIQQFTKRRIKYHLLHHLWRLNFFFKKFLLSELKVGDAVVRFKPVTRRLISARRLREMSDQNEAVKMYKRHRMFKSIILLIPLMGKFWQAQPLTDQIAYELQKTGRHWPLLKGIRTLIHKFGPRTFTGYRIAIRGKINKSDRTRTFFIKSGPIPSNTFSTRMCFTMAQSKARTGSFGIKTWLYSSE